MKYLIGFIILILLALNAYFLTVIFKPEKVSPVIAVTPTITPFPTLPQLSSDKLLTIVNEWRISEGRQPFTKDERLCVIAKDRADDTRLDYHKGLYEKYSTLPFVIQENLAQDNSEQTMLESWLSSPGHASLLRKPYTYSCIACKDNYCSQIFSNF